MVKRWMAPALGLALALSMVTARPAAAYRLKGMKKAAGAKTTMSALTTVNGIIKGAPAGTTYTVASKGKTVSVDASHATIRNKGKFAKATDLTPGSIVRASGSMTGNTLVATTIDIRHQAGGSKMSGGRAKSGAKKKK